jgi:hypothetical protein
LRFGSTLLLAKIPGRRYVDLELDATDWRTARARFTSRSLERVPGERLFFPFH